MKEHDNADSSNLEDKQATILHNVHGEGHPRNNSFDAGDKHCKISFSQTSYKHEHDNFQRHHLKPILCIH